MLGLIYNAEIISMDHFFPQNKESDSIAHIDSERFISEVLEPLKTGKSFSYKPYDCSRGDFNDTITVNPADVTVVEGSYSHSFEGFYDIKVFMTIPASEQLRRIKLRNPEVAEDFKNKWIPLEERYFQQTAAEQKADLVYDTLNMK
jgi:uridine kinase